MSSRQATELLFRSHIVIDLRRGQQECFGAFRPAGDIQIPSALEHWGQQRVNKGITSHIPDKVVEMPGSHRKVGADVSLCIPLVIQSLVLIFKWSVWYLNFSTRFKNVLVFAIMDKMAYCGK